MEAVKATYRYRTQPCAACKTDFLSTEMPDGWQGLCPRCTALDAGHAPVKDQAKPEPCDNHVIAVDEYYGKVYYESTRHRFQKSENGDSLEFVFCPMCGERLEK